MLLLEPTGDQVQLTLRLTRSHAVGETPQHREEAGAARFQPFRRSHQRDHRQWGPEIGGERRAREARTGHAHDLHRALVHFDGASEDPRIPAESPFPEIVPQNHHGMSVGHRVLLGREGSPEGRKSPERVEVAVRDELDGDALGARRSRQGDRVGVGGDHPVQAPGFPAPIAELRHGCESDGLLPAGPVHPVHEDQSVRVGKGQTPQDRPVENTEERRVATDRERERQHRRGGEAWRPPQPAKREPDVPHHRAPDHSHRSSSSRSRTTHSGRPRRPAPCLLRLGPEPLQITPRVSESPPRLEARLVRAKALGHQLVRQKLQVMFELCRQPPLVVVRETGRWRRLERPVFHGRTTAPTASLNSLQRASSTSRWSRPASVRRYALARRPVSVLPHADSR